MAQRVVVQLFDDLDGKDISGTGETVRFALDGVEYEIDLSDKNAGALRSALEAYVSVGRRVAGSGRRARRTASPTEASAGNGRAKVPAKAKAKTGAKTKARTKATSDGRGNGRSDVAAIRAWAQENGWTVSDRGRIAADVVAAYEASMK